MRMLTHMTQEIGRADGVSVAVRFFSLECELKAMKGVRIPHLSLTVRPDGGDAETWSVEADSDLVARVHACREAREWEPLLDHLAERFPGHPLGELAREAADRLGVCV